MLRKIFYILTILLAIVALPSCEDRLDYPGITDIPEGMGSIEGTLTFEDYTPALESRAAADAMASVGSLWVVVYNVEGGYVDHFKVINYSYSGTETRPGHEESPTACLKFNHPLPNGRYKLYAVANYDLSGYDSDALSSEFKLRNLYAKWENEAASVSSNAQMFGYFTTSKDTGTAGFEAQTVTVAGTTSLHAWLRRLASKVTIAFDTQNLRDNVFIYIKSVRLRDLPKYCYLGRDNVPASDEDCEKADPERYTDKEVQGFNGLESYGESILFSDAKADDDIRQAAATKSYERWLQLTNSTMISGVWSDRNKSQVTMPGDNVTDQEIAQRIAREHGQAVEALYFYENRQPKGTEGTESDKRQDVSGENKQVSFEDGVVEGNKAWKDARPYGTYVEVEGYYVCQDSIKPGRGAIKYRFMLGKDEKTSYDAERNHHYKLTLVFNGHANDVDFHIDFYDEGKPGFLTPPSTYVSYLYNQRHTIVAEATARRGYRLKWVKAVVLDNEWRRVDGGGDMRYNETAWNMQVNQSGYYASAKSYKIEDLPGWSEIEDVSIRNRLRIKTSANDNTRDVARNTEFGFLSLRNVTKVSYNLGGQPGEEGVSEDNETRLTDMISNFRDLWFNPENYRVNAGGQIHTSTVKGPRGFVTYDTDNVAPGKSETRSFSDGTIYTITLKESKPTPNMSSTDFDRTYTMTLPLYTRAKSLDSWAVYSGANPYYSHRRYARVRYIAHFVNDAGDWYEETSDTEVLQARRIDNPRGLFRTKDSKKNFRVQLAYIDQSFVSNHVGYTPSNYELVESQGPWTAIIERDPHGIIKLVKGNQVATGVGGTITGKTGSNIDFIIAPNKEYKTEVAYGAVVEVKYHDNNCIHKIIVRQGMADVQIKSGGKYWANYNLYAGQVFTRSPLSIGSFFKRRGNLTRPVRESNNTRGGNYGVGLTPGNNASFQVFTDVSGTAGNVTWGNISTLTNNTGTAFTSTTINGRTYIVPDEDIYESEIIGNNDVNFAFGIAYDVDAESTILSSESFSFSEPNNQIVTASGTNLKSSTKGVRGMFAYSLSSANNLFFPLGATGHGRRLANSTLHYGTVTYALLNGFLKGGTNDYRPMAYDLCWQYGAAYAYTKGNSKADPNDISLAMDINYTCYRVGHLDAASIYSGSNSSAMPIRVIRQ